MATQRYPGLSNIADPHVRAVAKALFDMVGNLTEWVGEWVTPSSTCGSWGGVSPTGDTQCLAGAATTGEPGALQRGGSFDLDGTNAGPLAVIGYIGPSYSAVNLGFRCAR